MSDPLSESLASDLALATDAVRAAGEAVMRHFRRGEAVHFKAPGQPVTAADLAADEVLRAMLLAQRPQYGWLSEESADSPERLSRSRVWVVDPIDGTNSFVEGRPEFVVSVGLVEAGEPVVAALLNPVTGELYSAQRGAGAWRNGEAIRVAHAPSAEVRPRLAASRSEIGKGEFESWVERWDVLPLGSTAYRMLKVADGTVHGFFSRSTKSEWDVCGAALVLEEAGGTARQTDGSALRFNQPDPAFRGIVAAGAVPLELAGRGSSPR